MVLNLLINNPRFVSGLSICRTTPAKTKRGVERHAPPARLRTVQAGTRMTCRRLSSGQVDTPDLTELPTEASQPVKTHLVLLINGLAGKPENWQVVLESLSEVEDTSEVALLASNANTAGQTLHGIDACAERLGAELKQYVSEHTGLRRLTIIGHSMGGLIARTLIGRLFDPMTGLIAGLQPTHFFAVATPHTGCGGQGINQVPFFRLFDYVPLIGHLIRRLVAACAPPVSALFMRRTGAHFFLHDREHGAPPLLERLAHDTGGEGLFLSALASFVTRTAYANSSGDHLVSWANASLRHTWELPQLPPDGIGVVKSEPLQCAYWQQDPCREQAAQAPNGRLPPHADAASVSESTPLRDSSETDAARRRSQRLDSAITLDILASLRTLPWRRVDVSFKGARTWKSTHNLIQVTDKSSHYVGKGVTVHLAQQFAAMEGLERQQTGRTFKNGRWQVRELVSK